MDGIIDVKFGQAIPPERWREAADDLQEVFPAIANRLRMLNIDGRGKEDANDFMNDAELALVALRYVAEFASDKCRFFPVPDKGKM